MYARVDGVTVTDHSMFGSRIYDRGLQYNHSVGSVQKGIIISCMGGRVRGEREWIPKDEQIFSMLILMLVSTAVQREVN